jgi:hypothetical protein
MTLIIQKPTGAKLNLRKTWQPMDPDAAAYITAVETADGQALEEKTKIAIDNFVLGCKADGIWPAIKASCILAGARTLNGALVPLVGAAPTNVGPFVSGDYNRKTGLVGDGSTKYLDSNRNNNADPQDNNHNAVYASTKTANGQAYFGAGAGASGSNECRIANDGSVNTRSRNMTIGPGNSAASNFEGLIALTRASSSNYIARIGRVNYANTQTSQSPLTGNILLFARGTSGTPDNRSNARLAFYSIGESLDLALLDSRVTDLINAIGAAIP